MPPSMLMIRDCLRCLLLLLVPSVLPAQSGWFPFTIPWSDGSRSATDGSDLLLDYPGQDPGAVVDARGFLRAAADGHFYFQKTGRRARFWGVNFTFNANYPPCPDEPLRPGEYPDQHVSEKVAAVTVECEISGTEPPLPAQARITFSLQPGEKRAFFLHEVFSDLPLYATGRLRIRSSGPIVTLGLLGLNNERGNFLIAALTGEPGNGTIAAGGTAVLPRIAAGAGYRTTFFLFPEAAGTSQGTIRLFDSDGLALPLLFR